MSNLLNIKLISNSVIPICSGFFLVSACYTTLVGFSPCFRVSHRAQRVFRAKPANNSPPKQPEMYTRVGKRKVSNWFTESLTTWTNRYQRALIGLGFDGWKLIPLRLISEQKISSLSRISFHQNYKLPFVAGQCFPIRAFSKFWDITMTPRIGEEATCGAVGCMLDL